MLLPGMFVALVTWLGARFALARRDQRRAAGRLLRLRRVPGRAAAHAHRGGRQADPGARRRPPGGARCCRSSPELADPAAPAPLPDRRRRAGRPDVRRGRAARAGSPRSPPTAPEDAIAIADRLGRYADGDVTLGGVPLRDADRWRRCASGSWSPTTTPGCSPARCATSWTRTARPTDERIAAALHAASAEDIVEALPDGLDAAVAERGPGVLRRPAAAAAAGPGAARRPADADPGRADQRGRRAHRGPHRATGSAAARPGRTTLVCTTSPLVLDRADHVVYVEDGRVRRRGHAPRAARRRAAATRATVTRGED